jgi:hypothetical protein
VDVSVVGNFNRSSKRFEAELKTAHVEQTLGASDLEIENARLQRLVAELLARNQQLRLALESATQENRLALR